MQRTEKEALTKGSDFPGWLEPCHHAEEYWHGLKRKPKKKIILVFLISVSKNSCTQTGQVVAIQNLAYHRLSGPDVLLIANLIKLASLHVNKLNMWCYLVGNGGHCGIKCEAIRAV